MSNVTSVFFFVCVCRLVSSIHALMATAAGIVVVSACRDNVIYDRSGFTSQFCLLTSFTHLNIWVERRSK